jgi:hypothetical protein
VHQSSRWKGKRDIPGRLPGGGNWRLRDLRLKRLGFADYAAYRESEHWQRMRQEALQHARYACEECGSPSQLEVHHHTYVRLGKERPGDLRVLCKEHHSAKHSLAKEEPGAALLAARLAVGMDPVEEAEYEEIKAEWLEERQDDRRDWWRIQFPEEWAEITSDANEPPDEDEG